MQEENYTLGKGIVSTYRRSLDPLVGNDDLRKKLITELEVVLAIYNLIEPGGISLEVKLKLPIPDSAFSHLPQRNQTRIRNCIRREGIVTNENLVNLVIEEGAEYGWNIKGLGQIYANELIAYAKNEGLIE